MREAGWRRIAWVRRRRALSRSWRTYRAHRPGMVGLVVLVAFAGLALAAPLVSDAAGLKATHAVGNPQWAHPGSDFPLGTDHLGRSVAAQFVWGSRISL